MISNINAETGQRPHGYAIKTADFLNSIGLCSSISKRGEMLEKTVSCAKYTGIRWFRAGYEGNVSTDDIISLYKQTGAKTSYGLLSGGSDIDRLIKGGEELAKAGALLSFEGPNEPNNWSIKHKGREGGRNLSWLPVAELQRDMYSAVKNNPILKDYPVFSIGGESGAQTDNAGLQFLTIPEGADTLMPPGKKFADYANIHNYFCHPTLGGVIDNMTWHAADPILVTVPGNGGSYDHLYGNYGKMWGGGKFTGYSKEELKILPRVTTETGIQIGSYNNTVDEELHGRMLACMYLSQFTRGFDYTAVYLLRDRTDESGNQQFGFYRPDYTPRKAADYLHNMTAVLNQYDNFADSEYFNYSVLNQPETVHDLLLQKNKGEFYLAVWNERFTGGQDSVNINFDNVCKTINIYDITVGTQPIRSLNGISSLQINLSDHPVIVEIIL